MKKKGVPANKVVARDWPGDIEDYCMTHSCPADGAIIENDGVYENGMNIRAGIIPNYCWTDMMGEEIEKHPIGSPFAPRKNSR